MKTPTAQLANASNKYRNFGLLLLHTARTQKTAKQNSITTATTNMRNASKPISLSAS